MMDNDKYENENDKRKKFNEETDRLMEEINDAVDRRNKKAAEKAAADAEKARIESKLAENSPGLSLFPGSTYVTHDGIKDFNKSLGNFKVKLSEFNKKHRKAVVRAELAAIIATAMLSLYNGGKAIKRQFVGREHIKDTVKEENEEIFDGLLLTSSGNLIYVDGFTMTSRPADANEIIEALAGKGYDASVISIALSDYKIDVDGSSFLGEWVAADKAAGEAEELKASLNGVSGRSR